MQIVGDSPTVTNDEYNKLHKQCIELGYFEPNYLYVFMRLFQQVALIVFNLCLLSNGYFYTSIIGLAITFAQGGWIQHEAGHNSLTCNPKIDKFIQFLIFNFHMGLSSGFWNYQHTNHHAATQHIDFDIDLNTYPLLIMSQKKYNGHVRNVMNKIQGYTWFWLQNSAVAHLWRYVIHLRYALRKRDYIYLVIMIVHPIIWIYIYHICCGSFYHSFIIYNVSLIIGGDISLFTFTVSHVMTEAHDANLDWFQNALLHTVNIKPNWFVNWWMGYLNMQIEHHLFPCMPQYNLVKVRPLVKEMAARMNLPYKEYSFFEAYRQVFVFLDTVGKEQ